MFKALIGNDLTNVEAFVVPEMNIVCRHCLAKRFPGESEGLCCQKGQVDVPEFAEIPTFLKELYDTNFDFRRNIRKYNQALAFTSIGCKVDNRFANARHGVYTFRVCGQIHHRIGSLAGENGNEKFNQIYFVDSLEQQTEIRRSIFEDLDGDILLRLTEMLHEVNPYVQLYEQARRIEGNEMTVMFRTDGLDARRYNRPTVDEVGAILVDENSNRKRFNKC